jgi:putative FmdB family regulatory protein
MPVYEFVCQRCRHPFEELVLGSEQPVCPSCGSAELEKQYSAFAVNAEARPELPPGCGTCGDPRGPGACSMN